MPPRLRDAEGQPVEVAEFYNRLRPGLLVAVWYDDDTVWHERLLWYEVEKGRWIVSTPDGDRYDEWLDCSKPDYGPVMAIILSDMGDGPALLRGAFYRFAAYPTRAELEATMRLGKAEAQALRPANVEVAVPREFINENGVREPTTGIFTRATGRRAPAPGGAPALPALPAPGPGKGAPQAPTPGLPGSVWVVAEVGGEFPAGSAIDAVTGDVQLDASNMVALRNGQWIRCQAVSKGGEDSFGKTATDKVKTKLGSASTASVPAEDFSRPLRRIKAAAALGATPDDKLIRLSEAARLEVLAHPGLRPLLKPLGFKDGAFSGTRSADYIVEHLGDQKLLGDQKGAIDDEEVADDEQEVDARCLPVVRTLDLKRHRDFKEAVAVLRESDWPDWTLVGPRTVLWVLRFIAMHFGTPMVRHSRFLAEGRLTYQDVGVSEHFSVMQMLEAAVCMDQLQVGELQSMEIMCRRGQMAELKHRGRFVPVAATGEDPYTDTHLYMGLGGTRGMLAVHPALEKYVSAQLRDEFTGAEARRKAREERSLAASPKKGTK